MTAAHPTPSTDESLLTVQEFALATGRTERTIRRHLAAGTLPKERRRGPKGHPRVYIPESAVGPFQRAEEIPASLDTERAQP